jgi:hypothetical protein
MAGVGAASNSRYRDLWVSSPKQAVPFDGLLLKTVERQRDSSTASAVSGPTEMDVSTQRIRLGMRTLSKRKPCREGATDPAAVKKSGCWCCVSLRPATRHLRHGITRPVIGRRARTHHLSEHTVENVGWAKATTTKGVGQRPCCGDIFLRCHSRCAVWSQHGRVARSSKQP